MSQPSHSYIKTSTFLSCAFSYVRFVLIIDKDIAHFSLLRYLDIFIFFLTFVETSKKSSLLFLILNQLAVKADHILSFMPFLFSQEHYKDLKDKPFFPTLIDYITSGPVVCMVYFRCE